MLVHTQDSLRGVFRMTLDQQSHYAAAAEYARRRYPGPVGELIHRELVAYAEFGHRFATDALIPRLVIQVLTPPGPSSDRDAGSEPASPHATRAPHASRARRSGSDRSGASAAPTGSTTLPPGFALWPRPAHQSTSPASPAGGG
jgi:hypothetical protein